MLTSQKLKQYATEKLGIDLIGVAGIDRFKGAPPDMDPRNIMPGVRSVIAIAERIPRGCYRGIDEGTHWPSYQVFGYGGLNVRMSEMLYKLGRYIESEGHEAVPLSLSATTREFGPLGPRPAPDKPHRDITIHLRIAATLAGVGEIGWSKVFLTEEFGPRQRIGVILTEAELEQDPIRIGEVCDRCKRCVAECPGGAISKDKSVSIEVEGQKIEWADINLGRCKLTHFGLNRKTAPHLVKHFPGLYLPIDEQEVTWLEAWHLGWAIFEKVPTYKALSRHAIPICGARGCIIGCMKHLEKRDRISNRFNSKPVFSETRPWRLDDRPQPADHKGFVYDPEKEVEGENEAFEPALIWY